MPHTHSFPSAQLISVNGVELEVFEAGMENRGRPIVLCHGWPELAYSWRRQIPGLVAAGYHVIAPNQRGYGNSSRPDDVNQYGIEQLAGDLVGLLDHYGYEDATYVGHDWGAMVVWGLTLLHPERVSKVINLSLPYQERGEVPWIEALEQFFGSDYYFVHFNRQPGVADAVLDAMDDWNKSTHGKSGLTERVKAATLNEAEVEAQMVAFLTQHVPPKLSPICGNSVHQDRRFLVRYMPKLEDYFL